MAYVRWKACVFLWAFGVFVETVAAYVFLGLFDVGVCFGVLACVVFCPSCVCCVVWVSVCVGVFFCGGCVVVMFLPCVLCL